MNEDFNTFIKELEEEDNRVVREMEDKFPNLYKHKKSHKQKKQIRRDVSNVPPFDIRKPISMSELSLTPEQEKALNILLSGENVFLSGKAGTGKSFLTRAFIRKSEEANKNILVCAPTGIAALNIGGATLHRTFAIPVGLFSPSDKCTSKECIKVLDKADIILIDEISMCRIDVFRFVINSILASQNKQRRKIQIVVVGDFFQLPPVLRNEEKKDFEKMWGKKLYAFESVAWKELKLKYIELIDVIRQKDPIFLRALNNIRTGVPDLTAFQKTFSNVDNPEAITICGRNDEANFINQTRLSELSGKKRQYKADSWGECDQVPVESVIDLAVGTRVIMVANDSRDRWANGTMATVTHLLPETIKVKIDNGSEYEVEYYIWETKEYHTSIRYDGEYYVDTEVVGYFSQLPVKLAYAITIHRSQGQTYDKVNIHPEGIFAEGQLYVALSRGRSLEGIRIVASLSEKQLITSQKVIKFYNSLFNTLMTTCCISGGQENVKMKSSQKVVKKTKKVVKTFATKKGEDTREKIILLAKENPRITSTEMAKTLGINRSAIQKHLKKLASDATLIRKGSKKVGQWWWRE